MNHVWILNAAIAAIGFFSLVTGVVSWVQRNPRPVRAPDQPPGGWPPPFTVSMPDAASTEGVDPDARSLVVMPTGMFRPDNCLVVLLRGMDWTLDPDEVYSDLRGHIEALVADTPALRQRRWEPDPGLPASPPLWKDDPHLDLDFHVRQIKLSSPGSQLLLDLLADALCEIPLDRSRPLWALHFVGRLASGSVAIVLQLDPAISFVADRFLDMLRAVPESAPTVISLGLDATRVEAIYFHDASPESKARRGYDEQRAYIRSLALPTIGVPGA